ncbi:MAG: ribosome silencing factor [Firmicutes bacterium]|nr:ribosome silencing factor [Bacillota bacterium]
MSKEASSSRKLALWAAELAAEKKAQDLTLLEVGKISIVADYFLIASGATRIQVQTICDHLLEKIKEQGRSLLRMEGYREGWWIVLDYGELVIHLFQPEAREFYRLERLWSRAPLITV